MTAGQSFACTLLRKASLTGERLSPNRIRWIERLPPYDAPEFDALSSAPPLAEGPVERNTEGRMNIIPKHYHAAPDPPQPVRRGSYADHRSQFPELYAIEPTPTPAAILSCLTILLDDPDSLHTILLVAETRGVGAGKVALELARKLAAAGIRER